MTNRVLFSIGLIALLLLVLLGCTMGRDGAARITATPTKTLRPLFTSTYTPTATPLPTATRLPTDTPLPSDTPAPTNTPVPTDTPLPADSPIPPTEALSTETPTATPAPPTDTPRPAATNTPVPPTNTPKPQVDFRVVEQRLMSKADNEAQRHLILIRVIDALNNPLNSVVVWDPNAPDLEAVTGTKPEPYHAEYLFWNYDGYQLEVKDARSEKTKVLSTDVHKIPIEDLVTAGYCSDVGSCNPGELVQHYSWYVTFQRTW
jgi:hypothetical protein